ncbi:MAG: hypothetical protein KO253_08075 [Methanobrevibacter arboriphilus]|nr:hypothetical protein [Methanobrevibacter arboriphilus]
MDPVLAIVVAVVLLIACFLGPILLNKYFLPKRLNDDGELEGFLDTDTKEGIIYLISLAALIIFISMILSLIFWGLIVFAIVPIVGLIYFTYRYFKL